MSNLKFDPHGHVYTLRNEDGTEWRRLPSVTEIIKSVGLINFTGIDSEILSRAADFGTAAHQACHLDDLGDLDEQSLDENLKPYLKAWRAFKGDMVFDAIEQPLYHPVWGFAGTPDRIKENTIWDLKTGTTVYPSTAIQLAGYAILADIPTARRLAVQLLPTGKFKVTEYTDRKDREIFLAALAVYKWHQIVYFTKTSASLPQKMQK